MAVFNSTKKKYPDKYDSGFLWFNSLNIESQKCLSMFEGSILNDNFHLVEFFTDNQKMFFDKQMTWLWFKCHLSAVACSEILTNTELANHVEHFALITHDKDKDERGNIKPPHTHICLKCFRNIRVNNMVDYFHADSMSNMLNNAYNRFHYLMHDSEQCRKEGKYQYDISEVLSDDLSFWQSLQKEVLDNTTMTIINAIIAGKTERYMCETFGDRYVQNKSKYKDCATQIMYEENIKRSDWFEIVSTTDDILTIYDKRIGEPVAICRNIDEAKWHLGVLMK